MASRAKAKIHDLDRVAVLLMADGAEKTCVSGSSHGTHTGVQSNRRYTYRWEEGGGGQARRTQNSDAPNRSLRSLLRGAS